MDKVNINIESQKDMKKALNFLNNNNLMGYTGFFSDLKIICTFKLKNKCLLVNYLFSNKHFYGNFNKILRSPYC